MPRYGQPGRGRPAADRAWYDCRHLPSDPVLVQSDFCTVREQSHGLPALSRVGPSRAPTPPSRTTPRRRVPRRNAVLAEEIRKCTEFQALAVSCRGVVRAGCARRSVGCGAAHRGPGPRTPPRPGGRSFSAIVLDSTANLIIPPSKPACRSPDGLQKEEGRAHPGGPGPRPGRAAKLSPACPPPRRVRVPPAARHE